MSFTVICNLTFTFPPGLSLSHLIVSEGSQLYTCRTTTSIALRMDLDYSYLLLKYIDYDMCERKIRKSPCMLSLALPILLVSSHHLFKQLPFLLNPSRPNLSSIETLMISLTDFLQWWFPASVRETANIGNWKLLSCEDSRFAFVFRQLIRALHVECCNKLEVNADTNKVIIERRASKMQWK